MTFFGGVRAGSLAVWTQTFVLAASGAAVLACSAGESPGTDRTGDGSGDDSGDDGSTGSGTGTGTGTGGLNVDGGEPVEEPDCDNILPLIVRDFDIAHPDFGGIPYSTGQEGNFIGDEVRRKLVQPTLGEGRKPVFLNAKGCAAPDSYLNVAVDSCADWGTSIPDALTTAENFAQWYLDTPGQNISFDKELVLEDQGDGTYVYDTDAFFPLGPEEGFGAPVGEPSDNITPGRNYLFTSEVHLQFTYVTGQRFTFRGDDDLWVFINGNLALDLGSMHAPKQATIDFDAQAEALGIAPNGSYAMDIFHAERRWNGSNFRIETNISCFVPVTVGVIR